MSEQKNKTDDFNEKNKTLAEVGVIDANEKWPIHVTLESYDGGEAKLQLIRKGERKGEEKRRPVGRMTQAEVVALFGMGDEILAAFPS